VGAARHSSTRCYHVGIRIALTSDLHVDHHPTVIGLVAERVRALAGGPADVLVVAGDVTSDLDGLERALTGLRGAAQRAVFVPGNHDLWCLAGTPSSRDRYEREIPRRARAAGFDPLGHEPVAIDGVTFVGVTGWYDYSLRNRELDATFTFEDYRRGAWGRLRWNDKARISWPADDGGELDDPAICAAQVALLERQLAAAGAHPTVVVTHHLAFAELVTSTGEAPWDFLNGFMGSARLGDAIRRAPGVRVACAGHTHFRKHATIAGASGPIRLEVSPVGYPREYKRAGVELAARVADRVTLINLDAPAAFG
jgi:Calcineurin-like phosphoesterase